MPDAEGADGLLVHLPSSLQALLLLVGHQSLTGTRSQLSVKISDIETFLFQDYLSLANLVTAEVHNASARVLLASCRLGLSSLIGSLTLLRFGRALLQRRRALAGGTGFLLLAFDCILVPRLRALAAGRPVLVGISILEFHGLLVLPFSTLLLVYCGRALSRGLARTLCRFAALLWRSLFLRAAFLRFFAAALLTR